MSDPLVLALPSKGRLKDQIDAWLAKCGLPLSLAEGPRGYRARLEGLDGIEVRLASAGDIVGLLASGEAHLGITGEDLLAEAQAAGPYAGLTLRRLGFGQADLVVAVPRSWIDVETMADLDEVAHLHHARTGARLRIATKYPAQTRGFFNRHGLADYRIVESGGATEGAPSAGLAEVITDITTTGATLAANGLRPLADGPMLSSQAVLAASLTAVWDKMRLGVCESLVLIVEAADRARAMASVIWPAEKEQPARRALDGLAGFRSERTHGVLVTRADLFATAARLAAAGVGPFSVTAPDYVFESASAAFDALCATLGPV